MAKWKPKVGDKLYLLKDNVPMGLIKNEKYGTLIEISDQHYITESITGKISRYAFVNADEVFFKWLKNTPLEIEVVKTKRNSKKAMEIVEEEDLENPILNETEYNQADNEDEA